MRAVVAGGAGFIGSHVCESLLDAGWQVTCIDNLLTGDPRNLDGIQGRPGFDFIRCDVTNAPGLTADLVLHLASPASPVHYSLHPIQTMLANSEGTRRMLEIARASSARFLYTSTSEVYGDPAVHPQVEGYWGNVNPVGPRSCYDEGKRFGEALTMAFVREAGVNATILRLFNVYGPRMQLDDGRVIPTFFAQACRRQPLSVYGDGGQTRSLCYVSDLVRGLLQVAMDRDCAGEVFNIGNPEEVTVLELATLVNRTVHNGAGVRFEPLPVDDPTRRRPDITKIHQRFGWLPEIDLGQGLEMVAPYFRTRLGLNGVRA